MKKLSFFIAAAILCVSSLSAQKKETDNINWQKIISASVDFKTNKNAVTLAATDNYKSLQIRTGNAPVHIDNIVVVFENADPENVPVRFDFKANAQSRAIELSNNKSKIKEIDIIYRAVTNSKADMASIEIWGVK